MAKLNQIVAVVSGKKTRLEKEYGDLNKTLQKHDLFNGLTRKYQSIEEGGEQLPPESKLAVKSVGDVLADAKRILTDTMNAIATQEYGNCGALGDVVVDGKALLSGVPVTVLLYLEKQCNDLNTFVGNIPTLDASETWKLDSNSGQYVTDEVKTHRTKKIARPIVLYAATVEHPAQTQLIQEDVLAGYWGTIKSSTAIPASDKRDMLARIGKLIEAVKIAREQANNIDVKDSPIAAPVLNYVFGN